MNTSPNTLVSVASPWAIQVLELIDGVIQDRVLVYGSLPPEGGDLDLLARPAELDAIHVALIHAGFVAVRQVLVRFRPGSCEIVELTPADAWGLPRDELEALFAEARPVDGVRRLVRPSPHHALLIRARKAARQRTLSQKQRHRTEVALAEDRDAWQRASVRAPTWHAPHALALLKAASEREGRMPVTTRWRAYTEQVGSTGVHPLRGQLRVARLFVPRLPFLPHLRRTRVVAFSGLDGSGKSSQARLLCAALASGGQDAVVIWAGIGRNRSLTRIKAPVKRCLRALPRVGPLKEVVERVTPRADGKPNPLAEPGRPGRHRHHGFWFTLMTQVWLTVMALANAYTLRKVLLRSFGRGRIVIFDRYTLDSAVRLRHWYGDSLVARLVVRLFHALVKRPIKAYFLDVPPQVAFDRKPEWEIGDLECRAALYEDEYARLGVRRLDGTRPADELCAEIAADVWDALR